VAYDRAAQTNPAIATLTVKRNLELALGVLARVLAGQQLQVCPPNGAGQ
jgi:hypothetical protein